MHRYYYVTYQTLPDTAEAVHDSKLATTGLESSEPNDYNVYLRNGATYIATGDLQEAQAKATKRQS